MSQTELAYNEQRLGKIVALAKAGIGGEKENAIKLVKSICDKYDLIYDDVMNQTELVECELAYKKDSLQTLGAQVIRRYGSNEADESVYFNKHDKILYYKTTMAKHIEVLNAFTTLSRVYLQEKKLIEEQILTAFINKHDLFNPHPRKSETPPRAKMTKQEEKAMLSLMTIMQDVEIRKQLVNK